MTKISVLGCGWLGFPLAKALINAGFETKGSTTTISKLSLLLNAGMEPFQIILSENGMSGDVTAFLDSNILIVAIPPKLRAAVKENFVAKIQHLITEIDKSKIKKVLFISSTSVYADDNTIISDNKIPNPDNEISKQLYAAEQLLQSKNFKTTILRFGGLIGEDRHPIKFLAGKQNLENPDGPINLIHQDDCIAIILQIITQDVWDETFNAAVPFHPTRKEYYTDQAKFRNLPAPIFENGISVGKTILSDKLQSVLHFEFRHKKL